MIRKWLEDDYKIFDLINYIHQLYTRSQHKYLMFAIQKRFFESYLLFWALIVFSRNFSKLL